MRFVNEKQVKLLLELYGRGEKVSITELADRTDTPYAYCNQQVHRMDGLGLLDIFSLNQGNMGAIMLSKKGEALAENMKKQKQKLKSEAREDE